MTPTLESVSILTVVLVQFALAQYESSGAQKCEFVDELSKVICCTKDIQEDCYAQLAAQQLILEEKARVAEFDAEARIVYEYGVTVVAILAGVVFLCCGIVFCHLKCRGHYSRKQQQQKKQAAQKKSDSVDEESSSRQESSPEDSDLVKLSNKQPNNIPKVSSTQVTIESVHELKQFQQKMQRKQTYKDLIEEAKEIIPDKLEISSSEAESNHGRIIDSSLLELEQEVQRIADEIKPNGPNGKRNASVTDLHSLQTLPGYTNVMYDHEEMPTGHLQQSMASVSKIDLSMEAPLERAWSQVELKPNAETHQQLRNQKGARFKSSETFKLKSEFTVIPPQSSYDPQSLNALGLQINNESDSDEFEKDMRQYNALKRMNTQKLDRNKK